MGIQGGVGIEKPVFAQKITPSGAWMMELLPAETKELKKDNTVAPEGE